MKRDKKNQLQKPQVLTESEYEKLDIQVVIQSQLDQYYSAIAQEKENRVKVRNWQITVLIAIIAYLTSDNVSQAISSRSFSILFLTSIISIFWMVEGFYQSLNLAYYKRVGELEILLADRVHKPKVIPSTLFFEKGFFTVSTFDKFVFYIKACFLCKSILFFNGLLIVFSVAISFVLFEL